MSSVSSVSAGLGGLGRSRESLAGPSAVRGAVTLMSLMQYATDRIEKLEQHAGSDPALGYGDAVLSPPRAGARGDSPTPSGRSPGGDENVLAEARTAAHVAWADAQHEFEGMSRAARAQSPFTLVRLYMERASDTDFANRARRVAPTPSPARYIYTESRRDVLQRSLSDVLRRYAEHVEPTAEPAKPAHAEPRQDGSLPDALPAGLVSVPAQFYLVHVLHTKRRALVGCYETWLRELETWLAAALGHFKRLGVTAADIARMHRARADPQARVDRYVRAVFELFVVFEALVDYMRHMIVLAEKELALERRARPHLDAMSGVAAALVASRSFGANEYTGRVLRTLTADLITSVVKHGFIAEHAAEYRQAVQLVLKEIAAFAVRGHTP